MSDAIALQKTGMFEENPGETSIMRVTMAVTVGIILFNYLLANLVNFWVYLHMKDPGTLQLVHFGSNEFFIITAAIGGKVFQKYQEMKK